jgi:CxxC-x17-CxxC domain-containing protein
MAFRSGRGFRESRMHKGHWTCADCGKEITELPFEPTPGRPVYCKECWEKRRGLAKV